jgi:beta-lactam-binding protein with PASTA domain
MPRSFSTTLKSPHTKKVLLVIGLLLTLVLVCDNVIMPWYVSRGAVVEVPSVVGIQFERAKVLLDSVGLQPREGDIHPDLRYPQGSVISQSPFSGTKVRAGRRVYLSISGGEPVSEVPLVRGRSLRDASFSLERAGFSLGETTYAQSDQFPPNTIVDQGVPAGTRLKKGTRIPVVVSQGKETDRIAVPSVVGKILLEAERLLSRQGLKLGNVTYQENLELLPNTVLEQYPRSGELVGLGQPVDLFVVKAGGKKPKESLEN